MSNLYERLGGADGIATLVDDIIEAHMCNPTISARFLPYRERPEELSQAKAHLHSFICMGTGGPEEYTGNGMVQAHCGMNIDATEYMAAIDDIMLVLDRHQVDEQSKKDVLAIAYSLKGEIMHA